MTCTNPVQPLQPGLRRVEKVDQTVFLQLNAKKPNQPEMADPNRTRRKVAHNFPNGVLPAVFASIVAQVLLRTYIVILQEY